MVWFLLWLLVFFYAYTNSFHRAVMILFYVIFFGLSVLWLYLAYDAYQGSLSAIPKAEYPNTLFVDIFSKEARLEEAKSRLYIGLVLLVGTAGSLLKFKI